MMNNKNWFQLNDLHRTLRKQTTINSYGSPFENVLDFDAYLLSTKSYIQQFNTFYNEAFDSNYRRSTGALRVKITNGFKLNAKITPSNSIMELNLGSLLILEDACQTIFADPGTILSLNEGETYEDEEVICLNNFNFFDYNRFYDFTPINEVLKGHGFGNYPEDYLKFLFKFCSRSRYRQELGDLASDIALYWILAHEDAHKYLGHLAYFTPTIGFKKENYKFHEIIDQIILEKHNSTWKDRKAAELEADTNATMATVDFFLDGNIFEVYPGLNKSLWVQHDSKISFLARLIISSITIVLACFERSIKKNPPISFFYPPISQRIINIIHNAFIRCNYFTKRYNLNWNGAQKSKMLELLVTEDFYSILSNLLDSNHILLDSSMVYESDKESLKSLTNYSFFEALLLYFNSIGNSIPIFKTPNSLAENIIKEYIELNIESHKASINKFSSFRLKENQSNKGKILESLKHTQSNLERLEYLLG